MTTPERSIEETDCEKYEHIPEAYDVASWHCKVCKKELVFTTLENLQAERQKREEMVKEAVWEERKKIKKRLDAGFSAFGTSL